MTVTDRLPAARIGSAATQVDPARAALTVIAGVFYGLGWLAARTVVAVWVAFTWSVAAVKVGWTDGRATAPSMNG